MPLSGKEVLKRYKQNGWIVKRQKGSHVQVCKMIKGKEENETIPLHKELKKGTELALLKRLKEVK